MIERFQHWEGKSFPRSIHRNHATNHGSSAVAQQLYQNGRRKEKTGPVDLTSTIITVIPAVRQQEPELCIDFLLQRVTRTYIHSQIIWRPHTGNLFGQNMDPCWDMKSMEWKDNTIDMDSWDLMTIIRTTIHFITFGFHSQLLFCLKSSTKHTKLLWLSFWM
jgi:hypothetical protein